MLHPEEQPIKKTNEGLQHEVSEGGSQGDKEDQEMQKIRGDGCQVGIQQGGPKQHGPRLLQRDGRGGH